MSNKPLFEIDDASTMENILLAATTMWEQLDPTFATYLQEGRAQPKPLAPQSLALYQQRIQHLPYGFRVVTLLDFQDTPEAYIRMLCQGFKGHLKSASRTKINEACSVFTIVGRTLNHLVQQKYLEEIPQAFFDFHQQLLAQRKHVDRTYQEARAAAEGATQEALVKAPSKPKHTIPSLGFTVADEMLFRDLITNILNNWESFSLPPEISQRKATVISELTRTSYKRAVLFKKADAFLDLPLTVFLKDLDVNWWMYFNAAMDGSDSLERAYRMYTVHGKVMQLLRDVGMIDRFPVEFVEKALQVTQTKTKRIAKQKQKKTSKPSSPQNPPSSAKSTPSPQEPLFEDPTIDAAYRAAYCSGTELRVAATTPTGSSPEPAGKTVVATVEKARRGKLSLLSILRLPPLEIPMDVPAEHMRRAYQVHTASATARALVAEGAQTPREKEMLGLLACFADNLQFLIDNE